MKLKRMKRMIINCLSVVLMTAMLVMPSVTFFALDEETDNVNESAESHGGWIPDPYERHGALLDNDTYGALPSSYDARNDEFLTPIRYQGHTDLCWLYSSMGLIEQHTSKYYGSKFNISKAHGATALSNSVNSNNILNGPYYDLKAGDSGNFSVAMQYFTNWNSPIFSNDTCDWKSVVSENSYPLEKIENNKNVVVDSDFTDAEPLLNVKGVKYIKYNKTNIKKAIMTYGGVTSALAFPWLDNYNYDGHDWNYFNSRESYPPDHAIVIVGWDDNYPKENFKDYNGKISSDGAWLIRNSNEDLNSKNYCWVSYYDEYIEKKDKAYIAITDVQKASKNEYMLSYDYLPTVYTDHVFYDDVYLCNIFDISKYTNKYDQISKVMFYFCSDKECTYEIRIIQLDDKEILPDVFNDYNVLSSGTYKGEGYLTTELKTPYRFLSNKKCAVVLKLTPEYSDSNLKIPYEGVFDLNEKTINPEINLGESYYGYLDENNIIVWNDCGTENKHNVNGNLVIRPVLSKSEIIEDEITITPSEITDNNDNVDVQISSMDTLFNIHTLNNIILRQDIDYIRTSTGIILNQSYISSLNGKYTELVLEFNNDITKTIIVNPKSVITDITLTGSPIVGDTITAVCTGIPEKEHYDLSYQWQYSSNGTSWSDIAGANSSSYTISENEISRYLRVSVTPIQFGNVKTGKVSTPTLCKVVVLGDVTLDGDVKIQDATDIQKYLVEMKEFSAEQLLAADANRDGDIKIDDVTYIQKIVAELI